MQENQVSPEKTPVADLNAMFSFDSKVCATNARFFQIYVFLEMDLKAGPASRAAKDALVDAFTAVQKAIAAEAVPFDYEVADGQ